jgi:hypothetical protein
MQHENIGNSAFNKFGYDNFKDLSLYARLTAAKGSSSRLRYRSWKFSRKDFGTTLAKLQPDSLSRTISIGSHMFKNPFRENMRLGSALTRLHHIQKFTNPSLYTQRGTKLFFKKSLASRQVARIYADLDLSMPVWPAEPENEEEVHMESDNYSEEEELDGEELGE